MLKRAASSLVQRRMIPKLTLTKTEQDICSLLKDYSQEYNQKNALAEPLMLRITGGWVRDKLLGLNSHDLDIAVNAMSGEQFALGLSDYLNRHHQVYGITPHSIHKIDKNPEKSKHLETATTKLFGIEVDFVNLRSEEYTNESRIPVMEFGTPKQDALRRDATLNALFYNIQCDEIEDFTGTGLEDLERGVLRTPLPPLQTFLDDPLRVLRLIRFASRFGFTIDPETYQAMQDKEINKALEVKISRERVGVEIQKILQGPNPLLGLKLIQEAGLDNVIFYWHSDPAIIAYNTEMTEMSEHNQAYSNLNSHIALVIKKLPILLEKSPKLRAYWSERPTFKQNFILSIILAPFRGIKIVWNPQKALNRELSLPESIIKDGLKLGRNDSDLVGRCVESHPEYNEMVLSYEIMSRSEIGMILRGFKGQWEEAHLANLALAFCLNESSLDQYQKFYKFVFNQNLQDAHSLKPMIDGKTLSKQLNIKPGPWMSGVVTEMIKWQLDNPLCGEAEIMQFIREILPTYTSK
ncbi:LANO_0C05644g1_1 [Lachancea nothofagi CBS 11611]|uniref:CCA tRNA nucleotidyltransferase, mitochondrial n=1 Tax=Lachancea nothofagi CBS 11611 TaxID=1266666 RepID=A0A1G4J7F6_9SACH|nr:LANO_0C05644g1_1 [Lachancea nothofagi CBS 11611]